MRLPNFAALFAKPLSANSMTGAYAPVYEPYNPAYGGDSAATPNDPDTQNQYNPGNGTVALDDGYIPGGEPFPYHGQVNDMPGTQIYRPAFSGAHKREIVQTPGQMHEQVFLAPTPNSSDNLVRSRTADSISATDYLNYMHGPVTGNALDVWEHEYRQELSATPPGAYGPVVGGPDYSNVVSQASYQEAYADYSTAVSTQAIVSAI
jgi:hypothetical protein